MFALFSKTLHIISTKKFINIIAAIFSLSFLAFAITGYPLFTHQHVIYRVFIVIFFLERFYETFLLKSDLSHESELVLACVVYSYMLMVGISIYQGSNMQSLNPFSILGFIFYLIAFLIRSISIRALGNHWNISSQQVTGFISSGIYSKIRHPYYLGVCFESISIPFIFISPIGLFIACTFVIPLEILRAKMEENNMKKIIGTKYDHYLQHTDGFIPIKIFMPTRSSSRL